MNQATPDFANRLAELAGRIAAGEVVPWGELLPVLCLPDRKSRTQANLALAEALLHRQHAGDLDQAAELAARAWEISGYSDEAFPAHVALCVHYQDVAGVANAYKRLGLRRWEEGRYNEAFDLLHHAQYAHSAVMGVDRVEFDPELLYRLRQAAEARPLPPTDASPGPRVRLGYLLFGITHLNSIMVRYALGTMPRHDPERFEVTCYVPERLGTLLAMPHARQVLEQLAALKLKVVTAPDLEDEREALWQLAARIRADGTEVLLDFAALADYRRYYLTCLRPAPLFGGYVLGPPSQFTPPHLDFCIAGTAFMQMDIPCDCELVPGAYTLPDMSKVTPLSRAEFGIPQGTFVLAASGRHVKFRDPAFWQGIGEILTGLPEAHFLAIGVAADQVDLSVLAATVATRIHCTGWRADNLAIVAMADAVVDTYPTGGGYALAEAMAMGIPGMAFRNDYTRRFDPVTWSPIEETVPIPDVLFERGDFTAMAAQARRLAVDPVYRRELGERCQAVVLAMSDPGRPVRLLEDILLRRLGRRLPDEALARIPQLADSIASAGQAGADDSPLELVDIAAEADPPYTVLAIHRRHGKDARIAKAQIGADDGLASVELRDGESGKPLTLTAHDIYRCWAAGYDFQREWTALRASGKRPSVAFTVLAGSVLGGGTVVLYRFAQWLTELGITVTIYSNDAPPNWLDLSCRYLTIEDTAARYQAIAEDVVIVYSVLELRHVIRAHPEGKAILHLCQGLEHFHYPRQVQDKTFLDMFDLFYALPVGRIAVAPQLQQFFADRYRQQGFYIPNGIDGRIFARGQAARSPDLAEIKVLQVGSPTDKNKNSDTVHAAFKELAQRHPDWRLHFVMAAGMQAEAPPLPADTPYRFTLHRRLTPSELRELYAQCAVLVNASLYEGFGLPSIEAMACGLPVVQGDNRGLQGIARDGENCLLVAPTDAVAMARTIERIVTDGPLRERLAAGGYATAAEYSLSAQFDAFCSEFEHILGQTFDPAAVHAMRHKLAAAVESPATSGPPQAQDDPNRRPFFSILVPTYNHAKYLPAALDSLLAQTFADWEAVVVNDGSTDNTAEILEAYAQRDARIRPPVHKANGGTVSALNEALRQSRGQWICWLSSDDLFEPDKLAAHLDAIRLNPETRFFFTNFYLLDDPPGHKYPAPLDIRSHIPEKRLQVIRLFNFNYLNGITVAVERTLFEELGGFDPHYRAGQDFDMWLRISARYRSHFIDRRLSTTRQHPGQDTRKSAMTGIIDSGVACLEFLNRHPFAELFPTLDLGRVEEAVTAIRATLDVVLDASSYIRTCGISAPLIERMAEWLSRYPNREFVDALCQMTQESAADPAVEPEVGVLLKGLAKRSSAAFDYSPYDPLELLARRVAHLHEQGDRAMADTFSQYIDQFKQRLHEVVPSILPIAGGKRELPDTGMRDVAAGEKRAGKRRVLFALQTFVPRNYGGVENYTYRAARYLMTQGYEVEVAYAINSATPREPWIEESRIDGIRVRAMHCHNAQSPLDQLNHGQTEALFGTILQEGRFDVVHFQHFLGLPFSLLKLAREAGAKVVVTLHDFFAICQRAHLFAPDSNSLCVGPESAEKCARCNLGGDYARSERAMRNKLTAVIQNRLDQPRALLLANADLVTVPSAFVAGLFSRYGYPADRLLVAPLGIEPVNRKSGHRSDGGVVFGYAGGITDIKNFSLLVRAFKRVQGNAKLRFHGGGRPEDIQRLQGMIADDGRISYHGAYKPSDIDKVFSGFDVLVQPSLIESYGLAVREAFSAGIPVIASRVGAIPELVEHLCNGLLFESGSAEELAGWLQRVVDQPELLATLRQGIVAPLTVEQEMRQWEERYLHLKAV